MNDVTDRQIENIVKEIIEEYTVDNEYDGRESMIVNGDFSQWQGTGFGNNLPVGWVENWTSFTLPQYGIGEGRSVEAGDALQITLTNATSELEPFPDRYVLRTESKVGVYILPSFFISTQHIHHSQGRVARYLRKIQRVQVIIRC